MVANDVQVGPNSAQLRPIPDNVWPKPVAFGHILLHFGQIGQVWLESNLFRPVWPNSDDLGRGLVPILGEHGLASPDVARPLFISDFWPTWSASARHSQTLAPDLGPPPVDPLIAPPPPRLTLQRFANLPEIDQFWHGLANSCSSSLAPFVAEVWPNSSESCQTCPGWCQCSSGAGRFCSTSGQFWPNSDQSWPKLANEASFIRKAIARRRRKRRRRTRRGTRLR